ncbi:C4-dicarboxylate transporter DctA [Pseudomonas fitomaticsae]|uniref:C4-dicarboxylate transporter DctA n=1 Tax=Pseudomonas fitomaticsae TaxID=2837969 RepID=A0ABY3PY96_9PSED|nr:C4-dicarboxylate transporter DctA [Pseudomonas fitomaticsae]UFP98735.1 C4-dicarboxylate transporter DctA [Pseudomonas fitomaticsae]
MKTALLRPLKPLYIQVLLGVILGTLFALFDAKAAVEMKVLGDVFIKLIKMVVAPVVFATVVVGIARMGDIRSVGRVGAKALLYFEIVTTAALVIGLVVAHLMQPGAGMNIDPKSLDMSAVAGYAKIAGEQSLREFFLHIIPDSVMGAFVNGDILPVVFLAVLFGVALAQGGKRVATFVDVIDQGLITLFSIIGYLMKFAPIGAFGAIAFTVGKYGVGSLATLGYLMMAFYTTCILFIFGILGLILKVCGVNIFVFLSYLKTELLITLGTASAEPALPGLLQKLEKLGCQKSVVGLVVPTGYAFNLDGVCIYLTMSVIFIAQATNTPLTLSQELTVLAIGLFTSKGMSGVPGGGFVALAATLASVHVLPLSAIALLVGIDRFMGEARAVTSIIGNAVAGIVISKWEGALDTDRMNQVLRGEYVEPDPEVETQPYPLQVAQSHTKAEGITTHS